MRLKIVVFTALVGIFITQTSAVLAIDTRTERYMTRAQRLLDSAERVALTQEARELLAKAKSKLQLGVPGSSGTKVTLFDYKQKHEGRPELVLVPLGPVGDDVLMSQEWQKVQRESEPGANYLEGIVVTRDKGLSDAFAGDVILHEFYHWAHGHAEFEKRLQGSKAKTQHDCNEVEAYEFTLRTIRARCKSLESLDILVDQVVSDSPSTVKMSSQSGNSWQLPIPSPSHSQFVKAAQMISNSKKDEGIGKMLFLLMAGFRSADKNAPDATSAKNAKAYLYAISGA